MKTIGIIAEYNPFHLGHLYQIEKIKELYPDSLIIAIITTNFTERGDISIINKWDKTKICLTYGIDLVVEFPTLYATQAADTFAYGALKILNELKIDTLVFGSESADIEKLKLLAKTQINNKYYDDLVKQYLNTGINYPTAKSKALYDLTNIKIDKPNDLLGLSYIKAIISNNYHIEPILIKRTNDYHGKEIKSSIINATLIRNMIKENLDVSSYLPSEVIKYINKDIAIDNSFNYLRYNIIMNIDKLHEYLLVDEGIESRIIDGIKKTDNYRDLIMYIKTKRYTYNKISRMLLQILLGVKKEDNYKDIYLRILGFSSKGRNHLNKVKKDIRIPIFNSYHNNTLKSLDIEYKSTFIYSIITNNSNLIKDEYRSKPIIF